ncbi:MAG TPA: LacI family DNA-binding transcriptional regulator [Chitinophagaceae bacterium]|jgi:LacI family transcriptional regulator|nr:LacI family DNA-binding transcriptional regulator [Chitinophagaceae bacterium]
MKKAVTLKDIALKLNMSVSTVSKALNNDPSISFPTRERVKTLSNDWNYIPNEAARHFKLNKTFTLGLIIPSMLDQFYVLAINGAEKIAAMEKYNVIISQSHEDPANEEKIVDLMKRNRVDGLIVAITKKTQDMSHFEKLDNIGIPVVFFARPPKDDSFDYVTADNEGGAFKATQLLIKRGHTRIGHLMGPESLAVSHIRLQGYKTALQKNKIPFDPNLVKVADLTEESTFAGMAQFMKMKSPPTAIFTFKNYISLDAIEYLKRKFPAKHKKIEFAGFGNLPLFQYLDHKPVASIEENSYQIGLQAAQLLISKINLPESEEKEITHHIKVPCKLVVHV